MTLSDLRETTKTQTARLGGRNGELERHALAELPEPQSHALIISGIRRCGKSTLLRQFAAKQKKAFFHLNFDDLRLSGFSPEDFRLLDILIGEKKAALLVFDEIQTVDRWELYVRQKLDEGYQVAITGSNASLLSRELGTKLTGRHITKELFPFSYGEYCEFTGQTTGLASLETYLKQGGFPEYLKTGDRDILSQLQTDILYRDIAVRYRLRDVSSLKRLFTYLVSNPAQLVSPSKLLQLTGLRSPTTVLEYISYFELSYLIQLVPCFAWSLKKQSLAPKKVYVIDNGIILTSSLSFTDNEGALLENFVYTVLRARTRDVFYFAGSEKECDFIVNPHGRPLCIQVCSELTVDNRRRETRGLFQAMDFFGQNEGIIITRNERDIILEQGKEIRVIPAWEFAQETAKDGLEPALM
ncbi:MAG: ATP-binding protein [Treponema sp.]|jgi:predicted AAA+ superfamily ATPase|nr:ATP-binding protein [Treponema sp.]